MPAGEEAATFEGLSDPDTVTINENDNKTANFLIMRLREDEHMGVCTKQP
jgi:hypothetical protein